MPPRRARAARADRASRERALWALEHALSRPEIPLDVKAALRTACAASLDDATLASCDSLVVRLFDVARATRDALANGDGATRGNGARACADALHATVTREDAPDALKRRGKDVVEALRGEWCFAAARETGREGESATSPARGWKAMENFWMRWRTLTIGDGGLGDGSALGANAKRTYDMVERAASDMRLPSDWESRVPAPEDIARDLQTLFTDLCESGELMSFLSVVSDDISSGRYKVRVKRRGGLESYGLAPHLEILCRKLEAEVKRNRQPPLGILADVSDILSSPPKRVHIAAERKKNARTVEWDSQNDQPDDDDKEQDSQNDQPDDDDKEQEDEDEDEDIAPTQQIPRAKPSPLTNLSWEEVGYRTPRANLPAVQPEPSAALKSPSPHGKLRAKVKWTDAEVTCLHLGVQRYGVGNWQKMLKDPTLKKGFHTCRTGVHLKDKWRVIQGRARR